MGGAGAIYIGVYTMVYLATELNAARLTSDAIFIVYAYFGAVLYTCAAGSISIHASYSFVAYLYKDLTCTFVRVTISRRPK